MKYAGAFLYSPLDRNRRLAGFGEELSTSKRIDTRKPEERLAFQQSTGEDYVAGLERVLASNQGLLSQARNAQLQELELIDARLIEQKVAVEQKRFEIEKD